MYALQNTLFRVKNIKILRSAESFCKFYLQMSEILSIFAAEKFQEAFKAPGMMIGIIRNERNTQNLNPFY